MTPFARRILGINLVATVAVMWVQGAFTALPSPGALVRVFVVSAVFCNTIGGLIAVTLPRLQPRIAHLGFRARWGVLIGVLLALNAAGCAISVALFALTGLMSWRDIYGQWLLSMRIGVAFTLFFGVVGTLTESLRSELERATLALRTKERDEAEARSLASEARRLALESRVQPHFLFNTLNSIASLIHSDPPGAERMTMQLAALLRWSLDGASRPTVPLSEEIRIVRDYLAIESVRLGDRLRFAIDVPPDESATPVPRMALQTVVENSVKYAVVPRREGGWIHVRAERDGALLRLSVEDDGPGFAGEAFAAGHGLHVLRERLAVAFGDAARVTISGGRQRTIVRLDIPTGPLRRAAGDADSLLAVGQGRPDEC
jgi:signal transduction histidine kinase